MKTSKLNLVITLLFAMGAFFSAQALAFAADQMNSDRYMASHAFRSSELMGMPVENFQNETLGHVKDVVFDRAGKTAYLIVDHSGFSGGADTFSAAPLSDVQIRPMNGQEVAVLDISRDRFANAPSFASNQWPDFASRSWRREVHSYYEAGTGAGNYGGMW